MTPFLGELIGTFILVLLGNGVVANVVLNKSKGNNAGWITIAAGWGIALFVAVYAVAARPMLTAFKSCGEHWSRGCG